MRRPPGSTRFPYTTLFRSLMEKPLADTIAGAEELVRGAAARGAVLQVGHVERFNRAVRAAAPYLDEPRDRKSTRLNSSHTVISYAVFCLKKKTTRQHTYRT